MCVCVCVTVEQLQAQELENNSGSFLLVACKQARRSGGAYVAGVLHNMLEEYFGHNKQQADLFSGGMREDEPALGLLSACGGKSCFK